MKNTRESFFGPPLQSPCNGCKDRFFDGEHTCHGSCEKYKTYREKLDKVNEEIKAADAADSMCTEMFMKRYCRAKHKKQAER